jgi:hypothetical protein
LKKYMKTTSAFILLGLAAFGSSALAEPDLSKLPPASDKKDLTYAKDIRPLFEASCFRCHGEERPRGNLRLDSLEAVLKGGEDGKVVLPGKSKESLLVIAAAQIDDETAMPPKRGGGGRGGPGGPGRGGGPGGPGGRGGFGPGMMVAPQMLTQADRNGDQMLTKEEFTALADVWFDKLDPDKTAKLSQEQFITKLNDVLPPPQGVGPRGGGQPGGGSGAGGRGGRGGFGPGQFVGPGLFTAADTDKDGSLTRVELKNTFAKWFTDWDSDKSGLLDENKMREGLTAALPRPNFGGPGGPGGPRGQGGRGGPGGPDGPGGRGGGFGPPATPLTAEQVGLVRAWIDQGAK